MEHEQLNLFGSQESLKDEVDSELNPKQKNKALSKTLFVIKDGKEVDLTIDEIFDKKFTKIKAITYSIDANFINKYLSHFNDMEVIVGIQDVSVQTRGFQNISLVAQNATNRAKLGMKHDVTNAFQSMSRNNQESIINGRYRFKVPLTATVHTKLYLLSNDDETETRSIIGSANLSEQAFNSSTNQHELVVIEDNAATYEIFERCFTNISKISVDYFNKALTSKAKEKSKKKRSDNESVVTPITFTPQEQMGIEVASLNQYYNDLANSTFSENPSQQQDIFEGLVNSVNSISNIKAEIDKDKKESIQAIELTKEVFNTKKNDIKMLSDKPKIEKITKKISVKIADKEELNELDRPLLVSAPELRVYNQTGLFLSNTENNIIRKPLGELATDDEISNSIKTIQKLIQNYENYVVGYDHSYGTRVIEAILYAFVSPFIWEIKSKPELVDGARTIPQFMILGGTANSGKSKLLTIIKQMMGLYGSQNWYLYSEICQGDRYKASKTIEFINACMIEENVNPFLVDELDADFFSNQNRGENLIVNTSNFYDNNRRQMPAFIGTTNALDYSMNERGKSRTYYLKIDRVFDDKLQKHSLEAFKSLLDEIDDKLFQDFVVRFSNKLSDDSLNWAVYSSTSNTGSVDFLYYAREIFKEYFEIAGIRLPEWFPLQRYDDKKETDKELWRKQYEYHKEKFKISSDGTVYLFNLKELDEYEISNRYSKERKPSDFYRQSMPQKHLVTTSGTDIIEIKVDSFHKWIGVDKPKIGLFKKLFSKK